MRKIVSILLTVFMMLSITSFVYADELDDIFSIYNNNSNNGMLLQAPSTIRVQQNGKYIDFTDSEGNVVEPQIINDRTMVPFRKIFNSLGVNDEKIVWNAETRTVIAQNDGVEIELQIDNTIAKKTVDGKQTEITLDSAPVIVDGRTLVPVRFIAESMNKQVGWDSYNRTVIIIDTNELVNDLKTSIPKYIEMISTSSDPEIPYTMNTKITGKLDYKDSQNKSNNSTINLTGTFKTGLDKDIASIDTELKLTGKGEILDAIKEANMTKMDFDIILKDNKIYVKSSLLDEQTNGKWMMIEDDTISEIFSILNEKTNSFDSLFEVEESSLTIYTYESLETVCTVLKELLSDEHIEVKEKGTTKTYTITIQLSDIANLLNKFGSEVTVDGMKGSITAISTLKNNVAQANSFEIKWSYEMEDEKIALEVKADSKMESGNTKITIPSESQVVRQEMMQ